ncbi:MAG: anthranilate phosphoribosyltransferase [Dehalococcoidia bacterium]|jgi:anthranilate phosphoribosyltransferase
MIKEAIGNLVSGNSLTMEEASSVMREIMAGEATQAQLGAFLVALRLKGETPEEVAGFASVMREKSLRVSLSGPLIDIVGTGGDGCNTFNISTTSAFVAAGAGLKVAKHGNRAMSSRCGSADVLEELGVRIDLTPQQVQQCVENVGIGFMFAQSFHPAMKYAASPRREIGIRTVFNILGPLTNPAGAQYQVIGVPNEEIGDKIALALCHLNIKRALVVHGLNGIDELSISGASSVWEVNSNSAVSHYFIAPEDVGLESAPPETVKGGAPAQNADILRSILSGAKSPARDVVLLNAAAGIYVGGLATNLKQAVGLARQSIDNGRAAEKLDRLVNFSRAVT